MARGYEKKDTLFAGMDTKEEPTIFDGLLKLGAIIGGFFPVKSLHGESCPDREDIKNQLLNRATRRPMDDRAALRRDMEAIGGDLRAAFRRYEEQYGRSAGYNGRSSPRHQ